MLRDVEKVALDAHIHFSGDGGWEVDNDSPHITYFSYRIETFDDNDKRKKVGHVNGYRITQDWSVESDLQIWDEADAMDTDAVTYVEALIREVRACKAVFDSAPTVAMAQRVTIVRHVEAAKGVDLVTLTQAATACLAMMDAPVLMLVDPWPMPEKRRRATGKLEGRSNFPKLLKLGFKRMVGSRFVWAWNCELAEFLMADYSYQTLLSAKRKGALKNILESRISEAVYGKVAPELADHMGLPDPDELMNE